MLDTMLAVDALVWAGRDVYVPWANKITFIRHEATLKN